ncbi:MAG: LPS export ABC transporter periplasmic protein LptC [Armatimonadetes bacterium]|nr:LPS export ABC transporter periplasmic protein LptC [Armatimonadota bacterium]
MSRGGRWILIGLGIAVVPLIIWALLQAPEPAPGRSGSALGPAASPTARPSPAPRAGHLPPIQIEGTAISTVDAAGRRQWDIRAESVTVDGASSTATLAAVEGTYFQAGEPAVVFSAPRGTFYVATRNVTLSGRVRARATAGQTLEADVVRWFPKTQQIEASGSVTLRQSGMIVQGDHLVADVSLQRTRMSGNIRVTVEQ